MIVRDATESDLVQINQIYNWHTENGFSTFGSVTSTEERKSWFERFQTDCKSTIALVAVNEPENKILGVACSFPYRDGGVFSSTVETSLYVAPDRGGKGIGSSLYRELFARLDQTEVHRIVVGIALPNDGSVAIHRKFGFEDIGIFDEYAFYKGEYRSSLWMQKKMQKF